MTSERTRLFLLLVVTLLGFQADALARVVRVEITERGPFAGGHEFGVVGAYERIRGKLHYAVDPRNPHNAQIVDLSLAAEGRLRRDLSVVEGGKLPEVLGDDPRNPAGDVEFSGDFILLKPVDLSKGNHRLLYDVNNRGLPRMLAYYNDAPSSTDPSTLEHAGNGWLMGQGYSLLWSGWNWDVARVGQNPLRINLPVIVEENGDPMTDLINAELGVQSRDGVQVEPLAWGGSRCYPVAEGFEKEAVLSVRDRSEGEEDGPRQVLPRDQWDFAVLDESGQPVPDPVHVYVPAGFEKGRVYELLYTAKNPRVVGLGLAAIRDGISFFHFETQDEGGTPNPLLLGGQPDPRFAYIFGISQSGRVITHMIYQGFHVDEAGRLVFEGARPHVAGGGKGGFNGRWAQTTHHPKHLTGIYFAADHFPFNFTQDGVEQVDRLGQPGRTHGDVLAAAKRLGRVPKILICNHGLEYWTRSASLIHTNVEGTADVTPHDNVRFYMVNGSRHGNPGRGSTRTNPSAQHSVGQIDQRPVGRALLVALDEWVSHGSPPPPSRVPSLARGELITVEAHEAGFPALPEYVRGGVVFPALRHPGRSLKPRRLDYGPRFWTEGIQDRVPPESFGPPYQTRVPTYDRDGNGLGGIRLPALEVPLGTHQAFNPRNEGTGAPEYLTPFDSSFWPFALTRQERLEKSDPRPSIEERYPSRVDYVKRVKAAAQALRRDRLLLEEDEGRIVERAEGLAWPPTPTDTWPFWELEAAR